MITSKPANGTDPGQELLYPAKPGFGNHFLLTDSGFSFSDLH